MIYVAVDMIEASEQMFQKTKDEPILGKLGQLFSENLSTALSTDPAGAASVELKARCLTSVGILLRNDGVTSTQQEVASIYDEVFADCICSVVLAAQGLDKPAQLVLRRVLELGVAAVYLWDLPHIYWGWKQHDKDLSFREMIEHLSSPAYLSYLESINSSSSAPFNASLARTEYRALSNVVHGKIATFETNAADRFRHSDVDWSSHLQRMVAIQDGRTTNL